MASPPVPRRRAPAAVAAGLAILALVVAAWFAVGIRQAVNTDRASAIVTASGTVAPGQARHAESLLSAAAFLNPDREVDLLRSQAALERGDLPRARALAAAVTRHEPLNAEAWAQLARASRGLAFAAALRHVTKLVPPVRHQG